MAFFFFSSRRRHTRLQGDWSSDVCSSDLRQSFGSSSTHGGPSQATAVFEDISRRGTWPANAWIGTNVGKSAASPGTGIGYVRATAGAVTVSGSGDIAPVVTGPGSSGPVSTFEQPLAGLFAGLIAVVIVAAMFFTVEYRRGLI